MSHGHSHHVEEHPGTKGISGIYVALIVAGFIIFLVAFVKSMSAGHGDDAHGTEHHVSVSHADNHSWEHSKKPLEFSSQEILGTREVVAPVVAPAPVVTADTTAQAPVVNDTTAVK